MLEQWLIEEGKKAFNASLTVGAYLAREEYTIEYRHVLTMQEGWKLARNEWASNLQYGYN